MSLSCLNTKVVVLSEDSRAPIRDIKTPCQRNEKQRAPQLLISVTGKVRTMTQSRDCLPSSNGDDGKIRRSTKAENLSEAMRRASQLHDALSSRSVHEDVLRFCRAELLDENYFHAVFEAMKSIAAKIRDLSGLQLDGADLVRQAFGQ